MQHTHIFLAALKAQEVRELKPFFKRMINLSYNEYGPNGQPGQRALSSMEIVFQKTVKGTLGGATSKRAA